MKYNEIRQSKVDNKFPKILTDCCLLSESVKTGLEQEKEGRERKTDRNVERDWSTTPTTQGQQVHNTYKYEYAF